MIRSASANSKNRSGLPEKLKVLSLVMAVNKLNSLTGIDLFPKIYITLNVPEQPFIGQPFTGLKKATEAEFREARKKYAPMDIS